MKALENYKVSKDCEFLCVNLHKYSHRNGCNVFSLVCLFSPNQSRTQCILSNGFEWGSMSRIDKENDRGKEQ